jgi:hypothetical protein
MLMMGVILLAQIVTAQVVSPSAVPSAEPPPTIVHVQSSALCTALRENVAPALFGLIRNDRLVNAGRASLLNLGNESEHAPLESSYNQQGAAQVAGSTPRMAEGYSHLSDLGRAIERNAETIDRILADDSRFPQQPKTDDEKTLAQMKSQLLNVLDKQKLIVNAFSGSAETAMMDQFAGQGPTIGAPSTFGGTGIEGPLGGNSLIDNQEMASSPALAPLMAAYANVNAMSLGRETPFDRLAGLIGDEQHEIDASENVANNTIAGVAAQCGGKAH